MIGSSHLSDYLFADFGGATCAHKTSLLSDFCAYVRLIFNDYFLMLQEFFHKNFFHTNITVFCAS